MIDIIFNGEKTLLIEDSDLLNRETLKNREIANNVLYRITRARRDGYRTILLITNRHYNDIPRQIKVLMDNDNTAIMLVLRMNVSP